MAIDEYQWLLLIKSREPFLKYQHVRRICWVRFWIKKLKMLARHV